MWLFLTPCEPEYKEQPVNRKPTVFLPYPDVPERRKTDMKCQKELINQGKDFPPSCYVCGMGPCKYVGNNDDLGYIVKEIIKEEPKNENTKRTT